MKCISSGKLPFQTTCLSFNIEEQRLKHHHPNTWRAFPYNKSLKATDVNLMLIISLSQMLIHRIGWWENLQESPIFHGKNHGFRFRLSLEPIQWCLKSKRFVPQTPLPSHMAMLIISLSIVSRMLIHLTGWIFPIKILRKNALKKLWTDRLHATGSNVAHLLPSHADHRQRPTNAAPSSWKILDCHGLGWF